jgi:hypothetical protein
MTPVPAYRLALIPFAALVLGGPACSHQRTETHVFFQNDEDFTHHPVEVPYPPLDRPAQAGVEAYVGVTALGIARFSRPVSWRIRRASLAVDHPFVEYVSNREYLFAIYRRSDDSGSSWSDAVSLYEDDAKKRNVEFLGKDVPTVGFDVQGREFVVRRTVKGQRVPYTNTSREFLFQGKHAFALVELVHQGLSDAAIEGELLRTFETFSVL